MLADDVGRVPIRIGAGPPLGVGEQVDLPVGLFERLPDPQVLQPPAPTDDFLRAAVDGMPERDLGRRARREPATPEVRRHAVHEQDGGAVDAPQEPPGDGADQRVVVVPFAPCGIGPGTPLEEQTVDPVAGGRQHGPHVRQRPAQRLQRVRVLAAHLRRHRLEALAGRVEPAQLGLSPRDDQLRTMLADRGLQAANVRESIRGNSVFLNVFPRHAEGGGRDVERLLDLDPRRARPEPGPEHRQLADAVRRRQSGERLNGRRADRHGPWAPAGPFLVGGDGDRGDGPRQFVAARQERRAPQQAAEAHGVLAEHHVQRQPIVPRIHGDARRGVPFGDQRQPAGEGRLHSIRPDGFDQPGSRLQPAGRRARGRCLERMGEEGDPGRSLSGRQPADVGVDGIGPNLPGQEEELGAVSDRPRQ